MNLHMEQLPVDPITIRITPTMEMMRDVVITALEGGIGYWALVVKYKWVDLPFPDVVICEADEDNTPVENAERIKITPEIVRKGLQLALTPGICNPKGNTFMSVYTALTENDSGSIDSDAADNVIQLGIFGTIRYA